MGITKNDFGYLREEIEEALKGICEKYNCEVEAGNITYDDIKVGIKVTFTNKQAGMSGEQTYFNYNCKYYGFTPEDYRKRVVIKDKVFFLTGFNPKARKNFCLIEDVNGKPYSCAPSAIKGFANEV